MSATGGGIREDRGKPYGNMRQKHSEDSASTSSHTTNSLDHRPGFRNKISLRRNPLNKTVFGNKATSDPPIITATKSKDGGPASMIQVSNRSQGDPESRKIATTAANVLHSQSKVSHSLRAAKAIPNDAVKVNVKKDDVVVTGEFDEFLAFLRS